MKSIKMDKRQVMYSSTYGQLVELRAQLRILMQQYKAVTTPNHNLDLKEAMKRSNKKKDIEDAIIVKRNSLEVNVEMHKHFAKEVNQNELIKIDMSEFDHEILKNISRKIV
jgi:hypothetical protein